MWGNTHTFGVRSVTAPRSAGPPTRPRDGEESECAPPRAADGEWLGADHSATPISHVVPGGSSEPTTLPCPGDPPGPR